MKWIWSIGNKINDGHKALAVLTLNNLSFDASLLLLHDAPSVFTTLCSNSWRVRRKWQLSSFFPLTKVCTSNMKIFSYAPHILCLTCVIRDGKQVDLQGAQRFVLFNMAHGQPTMGACHAVAWKAAESFILQLPVPFQEMFFFLEVTLVCVHLRVSVARKQIWVTGNIPCQREGEWSCLRDQSDGRRHPLWCPSSPSRSHSCPVTLHMALTGRMHPSATSRQNTLSLTVTWMNLLAVWTAD